MTYETMSYSNLIARDIHVSLVKDLLRQDLDNQIWETVFAELVVQPTYDKQWITQKLDLDDDEITVTITTKKGKKIEFTKKLEIYSPSDEELKEWDETHDKEFISRMMHPPIDEVGGNSAILKW